MNTLHGLSKDMLMKLIMTMQSKSLNLEPFLEHCKKLEKNKEDIKNNAKRCTYVLTSGVDEFSTCNLQCEENTNFCKIHEKTNLLNLKDIKFLFEQYPHYFLQMLELLTFVSQYHDKDFCATLCNTEKCIPSHLYIEKLLTMCSNLAISLPLNHDY